MASLTQSPLSSKPEGLFERIQARFDAGWNAVWLFRLMVRGSRPHALGLFANWEREKFQEALGDSYAAFCDSFRDKPGVLDPLFTARGFDKVERAAHVAEAASVVIAHSIVDAGIDGLLDVAAALDSKWFAEQCRDQEFKLKGGTLFHANSESLQVFLAGQFLDLAKRRSLQNKTAVLHKCCNTPPAQRRRPEYGFDCAHLQKLNEDRNKIIHEESGFVNFASDVGQLLDNAYDSHLYLIELVGHRFGLSIAVKSS